MTDPWLRGSIPGIPELLQPAAHAFVLAKEDIDAATSGLTAEQVWAQPGGITPIGFHLAHLAGSTGRLLTYGRGEALSDAQREQLKRERSITTLRPSLDELLAEWHAAVDAAFAELVGAGAPAVVAPTTRSWGQRTAYVRDPDGNLIELAQDLGR